MLYIQLLCTLFQFQHLVVFSKRAVIKEQLSKTKFLINYFVFSRSISLEKTFFQPQVNQYCNAYDNIQPPCQFGGDVGPFYLTHFLHRQSDIISFTRQWFPLIYFSTMGPKLFPTEPDCTSCHSPLLSACFSNIFHVSQQIKLTVKPFQMLGHTHICEFITYGYC